LVAILPSVWRNIPDDITSDFVAQQTLVLEHERGAVYALVMPWLSKHVPLRRAPMYIGTVEAAKASVALNLGMSIVPDVAVAGPMADVVVRPLNPPILCTLALVERQSKADEPELEIVRNALLKLRADPASAESSGKLGP
jgi:DNA-binding transcriptional LysR family regulator